MKGENLFAKFLNGSFFGDERTTRTLPFLGYLTLLALIAIKCAHSADEKVVEINHLRGEMKELEAEHREAQNKLMELGMESKVIQQAQSLGLEEAKTPPKKIIIKDE
jgi:hypothetical protein